MNTSARSTTLRCSPLWVALMCVTLPAAAQPSDIDPAFALAGEPLGPMGETHLLIGEDDTIAFAAGELHRERIVKSAPYCADAEQESVQPLADGNRIVRKQVTRLCRDGEGRTRQEVERGGRRIVYLRDPVSHESWVLDTERKTARKLGMSFSTHGVQAQHDASAWREYAEKMREWARSVGDKARRDPPSAPPAPTALPAMPAPPTPVVVTENEREVRDASGKPRRETQVQVFRVDGGNVHWSTAPTPPGAPGIPGMIAPLPPGVALRAQMGAPRGPGVVTSLGSKDIDGLRVNGERTTWTIEAGKVGNEKPIVITREVWTSPELMLTVQTRDADPRTGENNYRLAKLKRGEPDAALMHVPADYSSGGPPPAPRTPKAPSAPSSKG